jgi:hypothetical protein
LEGFSFGLAKLSLPSIFALVRVNDLLGYGQEVTD